MINSELPRRRFIFLTIMCTAQALSGDHVCPRAENYTVTSMETYTEPVVVNTFTWCLQLPPRCPKVQTEMRLRYRIKTEVKTRTVDECCDGYEQPKIIHENEEDDSEHPIICLPSCDRCLAGLCVSPGKCQCKPGYRGEDCAHECQPGSWGMLCSEKCQCGEGARCNPVDGTCQCPVESEGSICERRCPSKKWGARCENSCECEKNAFGECHAETGSCQDDIALAPQTSHSENSPGVFLQSSTVSVTMSAEKTSKLPETTELDIEEVYGHTVLLSTEQVATVTSPETTLPSELSEATVLEEEVDSPTTVRPVVVLVSVPERRKKQDKDRQKFPLQENFLRHVESKSEVHDSVSPKTDYVKTVHKDDVPPSTPVSLDIALIVVASIVSLGLTSIAVVMVLHMRSKLFETVRLTIYDDEKSRSQEREAAAAARISTIVTGTLPRPPVRTNPVFTPCSEPATILTLDTLDPINAYANGSATIGLRISGNLRDLLQDGHYDRPTATLIRLQTDFDSTTEHLYDEIPLQSTPLCSRKSA